MSVLYGADTVPGELFAERAGYDQVILEQRLRDALAHLNPDAAVAELLAEGPKRRRFPALPRAHFPQPERSCYCPSSSSTTSPDSAPVAHRA